MLTEEAEEWLRKGLEFKEASDYEEAFKCFEYGIGLISDHPGLLFWIGTCYFWGLGAPNDEETGINFFRRAAERGQAEAQFNLGILYSEGRGVSQNNALAVKWFRKAAEQGNARMEYNLADRYIRGFGVAADPVQAAAWFSDAAEQSDVAAEFMLALLYSVGLGVAQDYNQAADWCHRAARNGHHKAQLRLSGFYKDGLGVPQDYMQAYFGLILGEEGAEGEDDLQNFIKARDEAAAKLSPAEVQSVQARAAEWFASHQPGL
jgi:TPR repeat protein